MPALPKTILGHEKQQALLLKDIATKNVAHAYLFSGPPHVGKTTIAQWFAIELLGNAVRPEEKKRIADRVERLIHPDYLVLDTLWIEGAAEEWEEIGKNSNAPQRHRSKLPAKTDTIGVEDVRYLMELLHETSEGGYRVCVITDVERMNAEAANTLLKIVEEPPPSVVFILTAADPTLLPPTLVSRTRVLAFGRVESSALRALVSDLSDDEADLLLHLSRGAPGTIVRFLSQPDALRAAKKLHARARSFWKASTVSERLSLLLDVDVRKEDTSALLLHLGLSMREHVSPTDRARWTPHFLTLSEALETNTNRALALQAFTLEISAES